MKTDALSNTLRKMHSNFDNAAWERDISSYYMWKRLADTYNSELGKKRMAEIKAKYPNQQKAFE